MKGISTTVNGSAISLNLYPATVTPSLPARQVSVGQFPSNNPNFSRIIQVSDEYVFVKYGTYAVAIPLTTLVSLALTQETGLTWTPPVILSQPSNATATGNLSASGTLTSDNTNVSNNDTVTIGSTTYTFKSALTPASGEVLIGANADASLLNLIRAINHTGTPGTDYANLGVTSVANTQVSAASSVTSHAFAVTALSAGASGNSIATTETSSHLSWGGSTLSGGSSNAATFTVSSGSEYTMTYQWYESSDNSSWSSLTSSGIYSGATSATLTITSTNAAKNGYYYKCIITDNASSPGSVTTNSAILTVS